MPPNALTVIHKFIRREMFDFAERLFRAEPEQVSDIRAELERLADLLRSHAQQEDVRVAPLLRATEPALAERLARDHRRLDDQLESLRHAADRLDPASPDVRSALRLFHLDWNRFLSAYLAHLDDEERTLFATLGEQLPPLSTITQSAQQQGARGEEFLLRLWAVTTCEERAAIQAEPG